MTIPTVLVVPGLRKAVAQHWQTLLESRLRKAGRPVASVPPMDRDDLDCAAKVAAIERVVQSVAGPIVLVAHNGGCSDSRLSVGVSGFAQWAAYPRCACGSSRMHGRCRRRLADTPSFGMPVTLTVEVRRFKCVNHHCPQRTFSERITPLAGAGQRRTQRLREAQRSLGCALGGTAAARLAACRASPMASSTSRSVRRGCPFPQMPSTDP